jgi:hypothetical protein
MSFFSREEPSMCHTLLDFPKVNRICAIDDVPESVQ